MPSDSLVPAPMGSHEHDPAFYAKMELFVELLNKWRLVTNLLSPNDFKRIWERHIFDCAQLQPYAPSAKTWIDMGTGAGFPGLVIAAQLKDTRNAVVHCIESDHRRCAFLREAARTLELPAIIHSKRVEEIHPSSLGDVDAITARAVAPLSLLLTYAKPFFRVDTVALFPRGRAENLALDPVFRDEFRVQRIVSVTDPEASVLRIHRNLKANNGC